jgi:hypothetical protein
MSTQTDVREQQRVPERYGSTIQEGSSHSGAAKWQKVITKQKELLPQTKQTCSTKLLRGAIQTSYPSSAARSLIFSICHACHQHALPASTEPQLTCESSPSSNSSSNPFNVWYRDQGALMAAPVTENI